MKYSKAAFAQIRLMAWVRRVGVIWKPAFLSDVKAAYGRKRLTLAVGFNSGFGMMAWPCWLNLGKYGRSATATAD